MSFSITKEYSTVLNYPELGILRAGEGVVCTVEYTATHINAVGTGSVEVQIQTKLADGDTGILVYTFEPDGLDNLLMQAEASFKATLGV